jgi:hypothetical protein
MRFLPSFLQRQEPKAPREPSLQELEKRERQRTIAAKLPAWREEARALGLKQAEDKDPFVVLDALNRHQDELDRPKLEQRAQDLGIRVGRQPSVTDLSLAIYGEERRQRLMREEKALAEAGHTSQTDSPSL